MSQHDEYITLKITKAQLASLNKGKAVFPLRKVKGLSPEEADKQQVVQFRLSVCKDTIDLKTENKQLQNQVYNYRSETKRLKEYLIDKGINPNDILKRRDN